MDSSRLVIFILLLGLVSFAGFALFDTTLDITSSVLPVMRWKFGDKAWNNDPLLQVSQPLGYVPQNCRINSSGDCRSLLLHR